MRGCCLSASGDWYLRWPLRAIPGPSGLGAACLQKADIIREHAFGALTRRGAAVSQMVCLNPRRGTAKV